MKGKTRLIGILAGLLLASQACSTADLIAYLVTPTSPALPTQPQSTATIILTPSSTPITHTPTFTSTPTLIGYDPTYTPTSTGSPPPTETFQATPTPEETIILLPEASGFQSVLVARDAIYFGSECSLPAEVELSVRVLKPEQVGLVSLFLRLRNKDSGGDTGWDIGTTMTPLGGGQYSLVLDANALHADDRYSYYNDAWLEFQLVAFDSKVREIGRSEKLLERISLQKCPSKVTPES
jgi:hypothetical protein